MNKYVKWLLIIGGSLVVVIITILLIIPVFVDIKEYRPVIENRVAEATGRPFSMGEDLNLSLFPWAGFSFSDLSLGNPSDFEEKDFVTVKSFEVRAKLLPLLFKDIRIKRFVIKEPRIALIRRKDGRTNWEKIGRISDAPAPETRAEKAEPAKSEPFGGITLKALVVGEFAINGGSVLWMDRENNVQKEISDITFQLKDISLDRPIQLAFSALMGKWPLSIDGSIGPVGKELGRGTFPVDITLTTMDQLSMTLNGSISNPAEDMSFDMDFQLAPFSPRKLFLALGQVFPVATADPKALNLIALNTKMKGNTQSVSVSDGILQIDESKLSFSVHAGDFNKPDVSFELNLDEMDLDRYLPPKEEKQEKDEKKRVISEPPEKKIDYTPLRRIILDGRLKAGKIKINNARIENIDLKISGKNGLFHVDPLKAELYDGNIQTRISLDVRKDTPRSNLSMVIKDIQVNPLLKDFLGKDFIEGVLQARFAVDLIGDNADKIKQTLNGKGDLYFKDGAIKGIDLAGMARNVKSAFGLMEKGDSKPRTDFSELHAPFTIKRGVVNTPKTTLISPFIRIAATGSADLVKETLDIHVEPKFIGTLKGQGDTEQHLGITVPIRITGNFASPKFRPDLKGILKQKMTGELPKLTDIMKGVQGESILKKGPESIEDKAKDIFKNLPFGR